MLTRTAQLWRKQGNVGRPSTTSAPRHGRAGVVAACVVVLAAAGSLDVPEARSSDGGPRTVLGSCLALPVDAAATCTVSAPTFAGWFVDGVPALNGAVKPADSINFPDIPNCSFYEWSEQMFLWGTSPAPAAYGGGDRIFTSPSFFDVSPPDSNGHRTIVPHLVGSPLLTNLRRSPVGIHGFPVVVAVGTNRGLTKAETVLEVVPAPLGPHGLPLVAQHGVSVEVRDVGISPVGAPVYHDQNGVEILRAKPIFSKALKRALVVQSFPLSASGSPYGAPVFISPANRIIQVEQGQAMGEVLEAQDGAYALHQGSLVFYGLHVNDVFAYFLTWAKDGGMAPPRKFPTTQAELNPTIALASAHSVTFPDPEALTIELKTSWVRAAGLADPSSYITTMGTVPTYDTSDPNHWVATGSETVQLAMVGMHVVGSTKGHPEMIWATFEHVCNAPDGTYRYTSNSSATVVRAQDTSGDWLFTASGSPGPFDVVHMTQSVADIVSVNSHTISPSDTIRWKAWGSASDRPGVTARNTEVIAINNSVRGMLPAADVRSNYVMVGATWTIGGAKPSNTNQVGTSKLANATLETYQQGTDTTAANGGSNCFSCHAASSTATFATTDVSHIFEAMGPLF